MSIRQRWFAVWAFRGALALAEQLDSSVDWDEKAADRVHGEAWDHHRR